MTRIGRANEGDGDCWLSKAERQSRRRRPVRFKIAGEDLPGDHYRATLGGALQVNEQVLPVWTKRRLNHFDALVGSDTDQRRLIITRNADAFRQPLLLECA